MFQGCASWSVEVAEPLGKETIANKSQGNGIQKAFYDDPNILYISIHVHQGGAFYPGGHYGDMEMCGEGPGVGK